MTTADHRSIVHRADTGRDYRGLPMHAAEGVHDHALLLARHHIAAGEAVLDVGCGAGALTQRLLDAGFAATATDLDVGDYRATAPVLAWDVTDPDTRPEQMFAAILAIEVLEHVENPLAALRNLNALLEPNGTLIASTPNLGHPRSRIKYLVRGVPSYFGSREYHDSGHRTLMPDWLMREHLLSAGFRDLQFSYAGRFDLRGPGRWPYALLRTALGLLGLMPKPRVDDGACTFVIARKQT
ncbi:MAG: methyltransferase domain-containing protein [Chloroflexi bacterium]|nr:methyltransferase domain-containing protein [Chloroflexota bacterium]